MSEQDANTRQLEDANARWVVRWIEDPVAQAQRWWELHADEMVRKLRSLGPQSRLVRHLNLFLERHASYEGAGAQKQRESDRDAALYWITYRGFEETCLDEGRRRVRWRHFPADPSWRERAALQGVLFLLAREVVGQRSDASSLSALQRTCEAVALAESWSMGQRVPDAFALEPLLLVVWFRRCLNIARELVRDELRGWQHTLALEDATGSVSGEGEPSVELSGMAASARPDRLFLERESGSLLRTIFVCVCRDATDERILEASAVGCTEVEIADQLQCSRGVVRGRWNTLVNRARLLFKVYSSQQRAFPGAAYPRGQRGLSRRLQQQLREVLTQSREQVTSIDFWLLYQRLSVMLARKVEEAPDQSSHWNALSQTWQRATKRLLQLDASDADSLLLRDLVFFWREAVEGEPLSASPFSEGGYAAPLSEGTLETKAR